MPSYTDEYKKQIADRYLNGESSSKLEGITGHSPSLILTWVRKFGGVARTQSESLALAPQSHRAFFNPEGILVKVCSKCNKEKLISEFSKNGVNQNADGHKGLCNECRNEKRRAHYVDDSENLCEQVKVRRKKNPGAHRGYDLKKKFKLTLENYQELADKQNNCCAACGDPDPGTPSGVWHVDHDHKCCSGNHGRTCGNCIRGLLCRWCNLTLGNCGEKIERLKGVISYLEKFI
jgi:hypothetical protein